MPEVRTPDALYSEASRRLSSGLRDMEIDGGCDMHGNVPVMYLEDGIRRSHEAGMDFLARMGLPEREEVLGAVSAGIGWFTVYLHQDPDIINGVLGMDRTPEDYRRFVGDVLDCGGEIVPHISAGFGRADLLMCIDVLKENGLKDVVLDTAVPVPDSRLEESCLTSDAVAECASMLVSEGFSVCLGHCRDMSLDGLEMKCAEAGVRAFQSPSPGFVRFLEEEDIERCESESCIPFRRSCP